MDESLKKRLLNKIEQINQKKISEYHVVLLPDFFIDHFLTFSEFEHNLSRVKEIYQQGGGNIPGISQKINQGGNAANTALALARLGVNAHLICRTDKFGLHLLNFFLGEKGVDLSGVKTDGKLSITTALEFGENHTNIMIGDTGSVSNFSFDILDDKDLKTITSSDMLCVLCWNLNDNGTELACKAFDFAKKHNVKTFFDSGDPSPRKNEIPKLMESVLTVNNLDILALNENELLHYSNTKTNGDEELINTAVSLKKEISARIDFHTDTYALSINNNCTVIPALQLPEIYRSTGAGDAWNAGDIFAELLGFNDDERLLFANFVAGHYISSLEPVHPDLDEIAKFISKTIN